MKTPRIDEAVTVNGPEHGFAVPASDPLTGARSMDFGPMILIAEDNPLMRSMIRSLVEGFGREVAECADGAAAIELYRRHSPDLVLMDISMRPVDGLSATRAIIAEDPSARIVIITEFGDDDTRQTALAAGASWFFDKSNLLPIRSLLQPKGESGKRGAESER